MLETAIDVAAALLIFYMAVIFPAMMILLAFVHWRMPERLRSDLLREPCFSEKELALMSGFPLSVLKTLAVVRGVVAPSTMRKRFGSFDFSGKAPRSYALACRLLVLLVLAGVPICLLTAALGVVLEFS